MFISDKFNNLDTVTCTVTSSGMCGGQTASKWYGVTVAPDRTIVSQVATNSASVSVVPNPNKGVFTIAGTLGNGNTEDVMIEVTDMVGHTVYTGKATAVNGNINETVQLTGSVSNGNYLLTLRSETAHAVFHVVIEQ